jgi:zinc/manganese transport system substrate-binding protein
MRVRALAVVVLALAALAAGPARAAAQLKVVTSTTDLYDIARAVGGDRIRAVHIGEGYQDPHFVEAKPSFILQLRNADIFAFVGLDLEIGWMPLLLQGARNSRIQMGAPGYLDASRVIRVLDVPSGNVDRSQGDVHPLGNPHYWLDPENGRRIARMFQTTFAQLDPRNAAYYATQEKAFEARLAEVEKELAPVVAQIRGKPLVAWHTSWRYLAEYTGMNIVAFMEPKPGVPPSPSHLANVILTMQRTGARLIIMEPFYDKRMADFVASKVPGTRVLILPPSVGGLPGVNSYFDLMRHDITHIADALQ